MKILISLIALSLFGVLYAHPDLDKFSVFIDGFRFESGSFCNQVESRHYCNQINSHLLQCVILDKNASRLMGVEFIVDRETFLSFDANEKLLWHSNTFEVKSALMVAPQLSENDQAILFQSLTSTYGKTFIVWDLFKNPEWPKGIPELFMGFTDDGQLDPQLLQQRDTKFGIDSNLLKQNRSLLQSQPIVKGADSWMRGVVQQFQIEQICKEQDILFSDCTVNATTPTVVATTAAPTTGIPATTAGIPATTASP
jgi:hypothetical protein